MSKLLLLCFCLTLTLDAQQGYWLIGNYAPVEVKAQTPDLIPWDMYTHVNNFAIGPTQNCSIDDRLVKPQIAEFVNAAHRNGKSALITLKDAARGVFFSCTSPKN